MTRLKLILFWLKVAFLFLFRSLRSTGILSLMLLTAVAALIFLSALAVGVNDAMVRNSVSLYSGHITGFDIPEDVVKETLAIPGVARVLKRVNVPGTLVKGNKTHEVMLVGVEPLEESRTTAIARKVTEGSYLSGSPDGILLGQALAKKLGARPGDTVHFTDFAGKGAATFRVVGIYRTGIDQLDGELAFCPLEAVGKVTATPMPDRMGGGTSNTHELSAGTISPGAGWSAAIFLQEDVTPETIVSTYRRILPRHGEFKSWETLMPDLKQLIDLNYVSMSIVILLVFTVVSLGIACAFVIVILKSIREYGILKAMGVTSRETMLLIVFEVILMNLLASSLGVILGVVLSLLAKTTGIDLTAFTSHNRYFAVSGVIFPRLTPFAWGVPPALAFVFSVLAAIWPAVLVSRRRAAEILRIV